MTPPPDLQARITQMPDAELLDLLHCPENWIPEALALARAELTHRGVDFGAKLTAQQVAESAEAECKAAEPLTNSDNASMLIPSFVFLVWLLIKFVTAHKGESPGFMLGGALTVVLFVSLSVTALRQKGFAARGYTKKARQCWMVFGYSFALCLLLAAGLTIFHSL